MKRALTEDEYLVVETLYGLDKPANFEGKWNLHRRDAWRAVVERLYLEEDRAAALLASAKAKLFAERAKRTPPGKDEKVLAAWNGLAIHGMARAGTRTNEMRWIESAAGAADFIRTRMVKDGRLYATWKDGEAKYPAYLDDLREHAARHPVAARGLLARRRSGLRHLPRRRTARTLPGFRNRRVLLHRP